MGSKEDYQGKEGSLLREGRKSTKGRKEDYQRKEGRKSTRKEGRLPKDERKSTKERKEDDYAQQAQNAMAADVCSVL